MATTSRLEFWLRRTHMYAALFLIPWVLMYAISTLVMNHRVHLGGAEPAPVFETVLQQRYEGAPAEPATREQVAARLADEHGVPGRRRTSRDPESGAISVTGESPFGLRRVTFEPDGGRVTVEVAGYGGRKFLSQLHYRIGYDWNSPGERAWGFSVDLFAVAMLFWIVSGFWMWWTIRRTRRAGLLSLGLGIVLFSLFLVAL